MTVSVHDARAWEAIVPGWSHGYERVPPRRIFLREHREAKGYSPIQMAGRIGIERESYYRLEREPWRVKGARQAQLEDILDLPVGGLWTPPRPPGAPVKPSLDELAEDATPEQRAMLFDIARRILGKGA